MAILVRKVFHCNFISLHTVARRGILNVRLGVCYIYLYCTVTRKSVRTECPKSSTEKLNLELHSLQNIKLYVQKGYS